MPDTPLTIDLHLDLAWDALFWNRDLTLTAAQVRAAEETGPPQVAEGFDTGLCTVTFPEMRRGRVGLMLSTIMSRIEPRDPAGRRDGMRTQEQAMAIGRGEPAPSTLRLLGESLLQLCLPRRSRSAWPPYCCPLLVRVKDD